MNAWVRAGMGMSLLVVATGWTQPQHATDRTVPPAQACAELGTKDFSTIDEAPAQIINTQVVQGTRNVPAYCDVHGYIWPQVGFVLQLPIENWNEKFFEMGCGGLCGGSLTGTDPMEPLGRGYATLSTDSGHKGGGALWAVDNFQAQIDFGYRSAHVGAVAGKAITEYFYGRAPLRSYFLGGSTGGRQALIEAQRFPWDFDGIIAGVPSTNESELAIAVLWAIRALHDAKGRPLLSHAILHLVHAAVLARCDLDDGVRDGLIGNPLDCKFDPQELVCTPNRSSNCLSQAQAQAIRKVYSGPTNSAGQRIFGAAGAMPGSEMAWEYNLFIPADSKEVPTWFSKWMPKWTNGSRTVLETWVTEYFRQMIIPSPGPNWNIGDFDFDIDYKRLGTTSDSFLAAGNPDLRKFKSAGGKLIIIQGWDDPLGSMPARTIDYYEMSERVMGGREAMQSFARLFMVPGMGHAMGEGGGEGATAIDTVPYLEAWVERGEAPEAMIGSHLTDSNAQARFPLDFQQVAYTRPIYSYPAWAVYKGHGDPNNAVNFKPATPMDRH